MNQYQLFLNSIRSEETRRVYQLMFRKYQKYVGTDDIFYGNNPRSIEHKIIEFIVLQKGKPYTTVINYVKAILAFYKINDMVLNIHKINRFIPEFKKMKKDRAYTHQEIHTLLVAADLRMQVVIYILSSTGIRIGALPELRLRNLDGTKFTIYEGSNEEYITFCTAECKAAIDSYLEMRERYGEKLTPNSYLIREQFDIRNPGKPKKVRAASVSKNIFDSARRTGVRDPNVPICHGFRKFFTTQLVNARINPEIREMLLGHKIGLASVYYKPTEEEMLNEYQKAINNLTINEENRLRDIIKEKEEEHEEWLSSVIKRLERLESTS